MILYVRQAFAILDEQGRAEVLQFIAGQQNPDGGFCDRGGRSDLYYSLFAGMMLEASDPQPATRNSQQLFIQYLASQSNTDTPGFIEKCCLVLLQQNFNVRGFSKTKALFTIARSFWKERSSINLSYRSFVLFLTLDAILPVRWLFKTAAKRILSRKVVDADSPCSEVAAKVFLLKVLNQDGISEQSLLASFACETGGFKAFRQVERADMLSTAVSLFALKFAGTDLRLLKPSCLNFIQENYADGSFLSGDGDLTKDLEYTFYGMLALGVLAN